MENNNPNQSINPSESFVQTQPVSNSVNNKRGIFPIILGILIFLLVIGGLVYYLGKQNVTTEIQIQKSTIQNTQSSEKNSSTAPQSTIITQAQENETANWKTYTSKELSISFKYPPTMEATKFGGPGKRIPSGGYEFKESGVQVKSLTSKYGVYLSINTVINSGDSSYEWGVINQLYNVNIGETPKNDRTEFIRKQDITLSGMTTHVYENELSKYRTSISRLMITKKNESYYIFKSTVNLNITQEEKEGYFKIFDQILSTFKFSD